MVRFFDGSVDCKTNEGDLNTSEMIEHIPYDKALEVVSGSFEIGKFV